MLFTAWSRKTITGGLLIISLIFFSDVGHIHPALAQTQTSPPLSQPAAPLSAINWLSFPKASKSMEKPLILYQYSEGSTSAPSNALKPATDDQDRPVISPKNTEIFVLNLDTLAANTAGLLSPDRTNLPYNLWGNTQEEAIIQSLAINPAMLLPAQKNLLMALLLADAAPLIQPKNKTDLLLARLDKLIEMGALEHASALIDMTGIKNRQILRRMFDVDLLTGNENRACNIIKQTPNFSPDLPTRIFCLARSGYWSSAALTLQTAQALGHLSPQEDDLLHRFLDTQFSDDDLSPQIISHITPLYWRIYEAIGKPLGSSHLALAFSHAELSKTNGWKAQIEAAERLVKAGTVSPNVLLQLYSKGKPSASGGVWQRVYAFQRFEKAISDYPKSKNPQEVNQALPILWNSLKSVGLEVAFAGIITQKIAPIPLSGQAIKVAFEATVLSPDYQDLARGLNVLTSREALLQAIATQPLGPSFKVSQTAQYTTTQKAIIAGLSSPIVPKQFAALIKDGHIGKALLQAIKNLAPISSATPLGISETLALLTYLGLDDYARKTAIEIILIGETT